MVLQTGKFNIGWPHLARMSCCVITQQTSHGGRTCETVMSWAVRKKGGDKGVDPLCNNCSQRTNLFP
jgi:hypothetical protein